MRKVATMTMDNGGQVDFWRNYDGRIEIHAQGVFSLSDWIAVAKTAQEMEGGQ